MMLHEAVMLEIYRQALNASELASPRCHSRESNASAACEEARCSSNNSHSSANENVTPSQTPAPTTSPSIGLPLQATLPPAAAAALLPTQSAAMAAYFNAAAAAAAQQSHLLLANPLASLVQHAAQAQTQTQSQSKSPMAVTTAALLPTASPNSTVDAPALDFSTKRHRRNAGDEDEEDEEEANNNKNDNDNENNATAESMDGDDANSPLDLSVSSGRKRQSTDDEPPIAQTRKIARNNEYKSLSPGTWVPPMNPYLAAVAAANLSPKVSMSLDWNSKPKIAPNEASKALEKMTEMTRLGAATDIDSSPARHTTNASNTSNHNHNQNHTNNSSNGRHSAWQSHWLNKGADAVKDVFKCVWCKQSFPTLATLTTHMKETQHCGVNVPPNVAAAASTNINNQGVQSSHHTRHSTTQSSTNATSNNTTTATNKSDLNLLIKETMPLPRKLVRGQDVWLGKGAEQTREILKCMWCGQSFRSLAEMTSHMQETQHYTNIISQEQIISWKSSDGDKSMSGGSSNGTPNSPALTTPPNAGTASAAAAASASHSSHANANATVNAVFTCKVCEQVFSSLKELSNHMAKNSHYKDPIVRSGGGDTSPQLQRNGRGRQTREKRKKSLPVRKLLELERAQHDYKNNSLDSALKPLRDFAAATKITCEKCGSKIETAVFVEHIRQCLGESIPIPPRGNHQKSNYEPSEQMASPQARSDGRKTVDDNASHYSQRPDILCPMPKDAEKTSSTPSVLNALEQLIEKSFDTRPRHNNTFLDGNQANTPLGASILKRLGIDDTVDYTKPLMDANTMHFLNSYSRYSLRDRSASESSSVSERCSSRIESFTPDRYNEHSRQATPNQTPEKLIQNTELTKDIAEDFKVKTEPIEVPQSPEVDLIKTEQTHKISVKKEFSMTVPDEEVAARKSVTPANCAISPSASERSITPKSTSSLGERKLPAIGSSLNALSSMFDNLNNMHSSALMSASATGETNNNNPTSANKKPNANPLAALQKLCETTDTPAGNTRSSSNSNASATTHANTANNGNMVAFSWACNDAVNTADSVIKCSFCDATFGSKGAYRHHFSKVHFVKDDADSQLSGAMKSPSSVQSPKSLSLASPKSASKSPAAHRQAQSPAAAINPYEESPQSKFLKYAELAKQLSSKNV